jgi:ketosteroid isomerase-like protein
MSEERLEILRAGFDAFNRGDYESWIAVFDEDVEFHDLAETPDTGILRGHAGIRGWLASLQQAWGEGFQFEPRSITEADRVFVVDTRAIGVGVESGISIEMTVHIVFRFGDRKVVWGKTFMDRAEALEAAGLKE